MRLNIKKIYIVTIVWIAWLSFVTLRVKFMDSTSRVVMHAENMHLKGKKGAFHIWTIIEQATSVFKTI